jgi:ABC-2 type transport system ATP-binding protein
MEKEMILEVRGLKKYYRDVKAVDGISFKVLKGEVFTLLGTNGAGKTTTLEILEGLKTHDDGIISLFGRQIENGLPLCLKEKIGVVLQENNFIEHLSVIEILKAFRGFYSKGLKVDEVLKIVSLEEKRNAKVEKLSGGQRQRLAIGVALVGDPDLIFMDEPTTGLDPQARRNIWDMIVNLKKKGKTIFLTTHYMEEAEFLSDYIYIMEHGKIIAKGTAQDLVASFGGDRVIEAHVKLNEDRKEELKELFRNAVEFEESKVFLRTSELPKTMKKFLDWMEKKRLEAKDLIVRQSNLEDVFLKLTGRRLRD